MEGHISLAERNLPQELKNMDIDELEELAADIRSFLVEKVAKNGGHLASNLGVVELTIAMHKVFNSPVDKFIWDVGHQSYVHKILTGRAYEFDSLRKLDGMSGFPKREESQHDIFDTGHSSTSISIGGGIATARDLKGEDFEVISVIGDGALTGGMAYEALNNLGSMNNKVIVILNDNGMSISQNKGGMSNHLTKLRVSSKYLNAKKDVRNALGKIPGIGNSITNAITQIKNSLKYALVDGIIFEEMGFTYMGPVNGHNIEALISTLESASQCKESVFVHVITEKGKGYRFAEENPDRFHGIAPFDMETGQTLSIKKTDYSAVFGRHLTNMALKDARICIVCAAMISGTGLRLFSETLPERTFDAGIAEQHAVTFAAGLANEGMKPIVAIYSTFLQRAYDQIMEDVCMQNLPVIFAIDRAGIVGEDGETHHGIYDISYLSHMPNLTILAPSSGNELKRMLEYAISLDGPCAIRYPRGSIHEDVYDNRESICKAHTITIGSDVQIWAEGRMVHVACQAAEFLGERGISAGVTDARFLKPLDLDEIICTATKSKVLVTLEDNVVEGGFGEQLACAVTYKGLDTPIHNIGWPCKFIEHGSVDELFKRYMLDPLSITERICEIIER